MPWRGVPMRAVLDRVQPLDSARFVIAHAEQGFTANLPLEAILRRRRAAGLRGGGQAAHPRARLSAAAAGAEPLLLEERQVAARPRVLGHDKPGFWEGYGYHNDADPWREERYGF
jgi:DMSO/TMAO reductase YedYZ molybdopterin-dependent catalytic subunit